MIIIPSGILSKNDPLWLEYVIDYLEHKTCLSFEKWKKTKRMLEKLVNENNKRIDEYL